MALTVGDEAPGFKLPAAPGVDVDVGELIGREPLVLLFFPLAFSSVCEAELGRVAEDWGDGHALGAKIFGISVDSPFVTQRFREERSLPFPVLSDFNRTTCSAYGVLYDDYFGLQGVAKRSVFVVGPDGRIVYAWVTEDSGVEPMYAEIKEAVGAVVCT